MEDPSLDQLLANLRRQTTMSPANQNQQPQQQQQHQQQQPQPQPTHMQMYTPPMDPTQQQSQQLPFHPYSQQQQQQQLHQQFHSESPVYPPMHPFATVPESSYPGFHQQPPQAQSQQAPSNSSRSSLPLGSQPPYNSKPMSPTASSLGENRTASLLSLLKFSQAVPSDQATSHSVPTPPRPAVNSPLPMSSLSTQPSSSSPRSTSASEIVANLFRRPTDANSVKESASPVQQQTPNRTPVLQRHATTESLLQQKTPVNPQDLVLGLLSRPKPFQQDTQISQQQQQQQTASSASERQEASPVAERFGGDSPHRQSPAVSSMPPPPQIHSDGPSRASPATSPLEGPQVTQAPSKGLFTYTNPFDQLSATSPRNKTST